MADTDNNCDESMVSRIVARCEHLGQSYRMMRTGADEECERELELEVEMEEEEEVEEVSMTPANETNWDYSSLFRSSSITKLTSCSVVSLADVISAHVSVESLGRLSWSKKLSCTR